MLYSFETLLLLLRLNAQSWIYILSNIALYAIIIAEVKVMRERNYDVTLEKSEDGFYIVNLEVTPARKMGVLEKFLDNSKFYYTINPNVFLDTLYYGLYSDENVHVTPNEYTLALMDIASEMMRLGNWDVVREDQNGHCVVENDKKMLVLSTQFFKTLQKATAQLNIDAVNANYDFRYAATKAEQDTAMDRIMEIMIEENALGKAIEESYTMGKLYSRKERKDIINEYITTKRNTTKSDYYKPTTDGLETEKHDTAESLSPECYFGRRY